MCNTAEAVIHGVEAHSDAASGLAKVFVDLRITVVIDAVANFRRARENRIFQLVAVSPQLGDVQILRLAQAPGLAVVSEAVLVEVQQPDLAAVSVFFVNFVVTIVVNGVAKLGLEVGDGRVVGLAVGDVVFTITVIVLVAGVSCVVPVKVLLLRVFYTNTIVRAVGDAVAVGVVIAGIALAVVVGIFLVWILHQRAVVDLIGHAVVVVVTVTQVARVVAVRVRLVRVGLQRAVVQLVRHVIAVVIVVYTVRLSVVVGIQEVLIDIAVTVIIQAVAFFETNTFHIIADLLGTGDAVLYGVHTFAEAAGGFAQLLIRLTVTIVVQQVAEFVHQSRARALGEPFVAALPHAEALT